MDLIGVKNELLDRLYVPGTNRGPLLKIFHKILQVSWMKSQECLARFLLARIFLRFTPNSFKEPGKI